MSPDTIKIPPQDSQGYSFTGHGHLLFQGGEFVRKFTNGQTLATTYKCVKFKAKEKCGVVLKAQGKNLLTISGRHNHELRQEK
jgi:hypothetical protein